MALTKSIATAMLPRIIVAKFGLFARSAFDAECRPSR